MLVVVSRRETVTRIFGLGGSTYLAFEVPCSLLIKLEDKLLQM